jgi:hypothetical protein
MDEELIDADYDDVVDDELFDDENDFEEYDILVESIKNTFNKMSDCIEIQLNLRSISIFGDGFYKQVVCCAARAFH